MSSFSQKVDPNNANDLKAFNDHLANFSYAEGYHPSHRDTELLVGLKSAPDASKYAHLVRWYKHVQSFNDSERASWSGGTGTAAKPVTEKEDEDFDLFGESDEEDTEKERLKEERLKAYAEKKSKKPGPIAKSSVILDVKPWDDETDLEEMERLVRTIEQDGLVWGAAKLVAIGYGIKKLQIVSTIEDEKVSVDDIIEKIQDEFSDHVQSVDIVAFNKI